MSSCADVAKDPEAPWPPAPRSCARRRLWQVLGAAGLLLAAVALGAGIGLAVGKAAASGPGSPGGLLNTLTGSTEEPQDPAPIVTPTARLLAQDVILKNGTLSWYSEKGMADVLLLPGLTYDKRRKELVVAKAGRYQVCLYLELSHILPDSRVSGRVSLALHLEPPQIGVTAQSVAVKLKPSSPNAVGDYHCQWLQMPDNQRLSVHLSAYLPTEAGEYQAWQLAQTATKLELFQMAVEVPD
ncbi:tumor necrosis factor ligand superfamily member 9 [Octodon degus]|uniref:Tumor necrosis factor ligand superfamily member 9 n=1 Tax=Octodon degus TaxID=10160 RepID=A0A6P3EVX6_OCTDE|nr:tumor necrosis factor ligand superfamily member 9 [Octodon degus]